MESKTANYISMMTWLGLIPTEDKDRDTRQTLSFNRSGYRENGNPTDRIYIPNVSCI